MGRGDVVETETAPVAVKSVMAMEQKESQELKSAFAMTTVTPDNTGMGDMGVHENQLSDDVNGAAMSSLNARRSTSSVLQKNFNFEEGAQCVQSSKGITSDQLTDGDLKYVQKLGSEQSDTLSSEMLKGIGNAEGRQHHLLRHSLPSEQRGMSVLSHFGVETVSDAAKSIKKMSQRDLQAKFRSVYGTKTFSNNNNWLRRKLFEAVGLDPGKSNTKKSNAGGQRRRRVSKPAPAKAPSRFSRRTRAEIDADHQSVAEALLALAEVAHMEENGACSDGIVPAACRDDVSEGGLSWSSRGVSRDVPVAAPSKEDVRPHIPAPSAKLKDEEQKCANEVPNLFEYCAMAQRHAMQNPEVHAAMMAMMTQQTPPNAEQLQVLQQVQQAQQYAMMMYMQANPSVMQSILSQNMYHPMMSEMYSRMAQGDWSPQTQYFNPAQVTGASSPAYQEFTFASPQNIEQKFS